MFFFVRCTTIHIPDDVLSACKLDQWIQFNLGILEGMSSDHKIHPIFDELQSSPDIELLGQPFYAGYIFGVGLTANQNLDNLTIHNFLNSVLYKNFFKLSTLNLGARAQFISLFKLEILDF